MKTLAESCVRFVSFVTTQQFLVQPVGRGVSRVVTCYTH